MRQKYRASINGTTSVEESTGSSDCTEVEGHSSPDLEPNSIGPATNTFARRRISRYQVEGATFSAPPATHERGEIKEGFVETPPMGRGFRSIVLPDHASEFAMYHVDTKCAPPAMCPIVSNMLSQFRGHRHPLLSARYRSMRALVEES